MAQGYDDLPRYELRRSRRARRLRIRVSPAEGVVVVVPPGVRRSEAERFVAAKREWLQRAVARLEAQHGSLDEILSPTLPECIELAAIPRIYRVEYRADAGAPRTTVAVRGEVLRVRGERSDPGAVRAALRRRLARDARAHLLPRLQTLSRETGLRYRRARIGGQRTLWGSCSARGTVSLNYKLLFLSPELVRYVLLHELAHTMHADHSPAFWALVRRHEPACEELHDQLRGAGRCVPAWAEPR